MKNNESEEMYLETILLLARRKPFVRSVDVAEELNYSRPSISRAVKLLHSKGFIEISADGEINLTAEGQRRANEIYERHEVITALLESFGAPSELAEENACRIEHVVTDEMFGYMKAFISSKKSPQ